MRKSEVICDICKKDITDFEYTEIEFNIFNLPKVDLCKKCSKSIYELIRRSQKTGRKDG